MSSRDKQPSAQKAKRLLEQLRKNNQQPQQMQPKEPPKEKKPSK